MLTSFTISEKVSCPIIINLMFLCVCLTFTYPQSIYFKTDSNSETEARHIWQNSPPTSFQVYDLKKTFPQKNLLEFIDTLLRALHECGYNHLQFYKSERGFAILTPLEQVERDGTPINGKWRWASEVYREPPQNMIDAIKKIFLPSRGYYRYFVTIQ